jgi:hypothetical protein
MSIEKLFDEKNRDENLATLSTQGRFIEQF